jgi:hypothetical protein
MQKRVLVLGVLSLAACLGGCASGLTGTGNSASAPQATSATQPTEQSVADKEVQTKQVTMAVSGMT